MKPDKLIYLLRHGETDLNKMGIVQGRGVDSDLNDTGSAQAQAFFETYKTVPFDKVYTSSLKRTKQTVQPFIDLGIPVESLSDLDELSWGQIEGQPNNEAIRMVFHTLAAQWEAGHYDEKVKGGESPEDVMVRMKAAMKHIMANEDEKTILICMHGRAMRVLLCFLTNTPLSEMLKFPHRNTALYTLEWFNNTFTFKDFNNVSHLERINTEG